MSAPRAQAALGDAVHTVVWWASLLWWEGSGYRQLLWWIFLCDFPYVPSLLECGAWVKRKQTELAPSFLSPMPQTAYKDDFYITWQENCQEETFRRASKRLNTVISRKAIKMRKENQEKVRQHKQRVLGSVRYRLKIFEDGWSKKEK